MNPRQEESANRIRIRHRSRQPRNQEEPLSIPLQSLRNHQPPDVVVSKCTLTFTLTPALLEVPDVVSKYSLRRLEKLVGENNGYVNHRRREIIKG